MNLQIQCPKCSKRFTVHEDLTGKTVECGSCDHRFPVKPETVITERAKVYPGAAKKDDDFLNRLGKAPTIAGASAVGNGSKATPPPSGTPQVDAIMPASPGQAIAMGTGISLILLFALIFFLGSSAGGIFQDVDLNRRLLLGGFVALVGIILIFVGSKNRRAQAFLLSLVLAGGLGALIYMSPVHITPRVVGTTPGSSSVSDDDTADDASSSQRDITTRVGYDKLQGQIDAMTKKFGAKGSEYVFGIFVEGLQESQFMMMERYFIKKLGIPPSEALHNYKRNNDRDRLVIISGLEMDFDHLIRLTEKLGTVTSSYPALRLAELRMSEVFFTEPDADLRKKLTDPTNGSFFSVNLDELSHVDTERVKDALRRLSDVPPEVEKRHQEKIVVELLRLLGEETDFEIHSLIGTALRDWAAGNEPAVKSVSRFAAAWMKDKKPVPRTFVEYLAENQSPEAAAMVDRLWAAEPGKWSELYSSMGSSIEPRLQYHLQQSPPIVQRAAADLIRKIGTKKSLPILRKYKASSDDELRILVIQAIEALQRQ